MLCWQNHISKRLCAEEANMVRCMLLLFQVREIKLGKWCAESNFVRTILQVNLLRNF